MLSDPKKQRRMALKYIQNKPNFVREKNNALEAFIYKASRASKKVVNKMNARNSFFNTLFRNHA